MDAGVPVAEAARRKGLSRSSLRRFLKEQRPPTGLAQDPPPVANEKREPFVNLAICSRAGSRNYDRHPGGYLDTPHSHTSATQEVQQVSPTTSTTSG